MMTMIVCTISMKKKSSRILWHWKWWELWGESSKRAQVSGLCEFYLFIFQMNIDRVSNWTSQQLRVSSFLVPRTFFSGVQWRNRGLLRLSAFSFSCLISFSHRSTSATTFCIETREQCKIKEYIFLNKKNMYCSSILQSFMYIYIYYHALLSILQQYISFVKVLLIPLACSFVGLLIPLTAKIAAIPSGPPSFHIQVGHLKEYNQHQFHHHHHSHHHPSSSSSSSSSSTVINYMHIYIYHHQLVFTHIFLASQFVQKSSPLRWSSPQGYPP